MAGKPLADERAAASQFIFTQSPNTPIGVYSFGSGVNTLAAIDADQSAASTAVSQMAIGAKSGTQLYSAVKTAANDLGQQSQPHKVMLLMTDGYASGDNTTLDQAIASAKQNNVQIYAITTSTSAKSTTPLTKLTSSTGGELIPVSDSSALKSAYTQISQSLNSTYTATYKSNVGTGEPITLKVSANGSAPATVAYKAPGTVSSISTAGGSSVPANAGGRALIAGLVALLVFGGALVLFAGKPSVLVGKRIAAHTEQKRTVIVTAPGQDVPKLSILHQLYIATEKVAGSANYWKRMSYRLEQADLPLRTAEVFYIQLGSALLLGMIVSVVFGLGSIGGLVGMLVGAAIPFFYVKIMAKRRLGRFETQLPETLITLAASLKAGHAFNSALNSLVNEGVEPTSAELSRVANEIQLGMPSEQALEHMAKRMNSTNFGFVVMAVNIQRTVGGSLADILDMVADTVRQRQQFSRKVKALTAQGRMSAYVLLAMPFLMGLAIFALNQAYIMILFTSTAGQIMCVGALISMGIGAVIIQKIVSFKE